MPTPPPDRSRRSLSHGQRMFLLYGPADRWDDAFADEREVYEAWNQHRAQILNYYRNGRRPWAWWALEAGDLRFPGQTRERAVLFEAGLLGEEEREQLVAHWFAHFTRAQQPGFMFCVGCSAPNATSATWLEGEAARKAHLKWAGVPRSLVRQWTRESRRREQRNRELEVAPLAATEEPPAA